MLLYLYSEFMIVEALQGESGVSFNGNNVSDLRYADDAVLVADIKNKLQTLIDKLGESCGVCGVAIDIKKTGVVVVCREGKTQCPVALGDAVLEQVERCGCLGSWITENARCEEDIRQELEWLRQRFGRIRK